MKVWVQEWEETEQHWGVRFDGYSLHESKKDATDFCIDFWNDMPDDIPDTYSRPVNEPFEVEVPEDSEQLIFVNSIKGKPTWIHESKVSWIIAGKMNK